MVVHARGENHVLDFFVAAPGLGLDGARARRARADRRPLLARTRSSASTSARPRAAPTAPRSGSRRRSSASAARASATSPPRPARAAREGVEVVPMQAFLFEVLAPDLHLDAGVRGDLRARRPAARRGRHDPAAGARRPARPARRGGPGFLYGGDVAAAVSDWVLERGGMLSREDLALVRGDRARARARDLPRPRGAHEPAAVVGRDPDRGRARDPRAARRGRTTRT